MIPPADLAKHAKWCVRKIVKKCAFSPNANDGAELNANCVSGRQVNNPKATFERVKCDISRKACANKWLCTYVSYQIRWFPCWFYIIFNRISLSSTSVRRPLYGNTIREVWPDGAHRPPVIKYGLVCKYQLVQFTLRTRYRIKIQTNGRYQWTLVAMRKQVTSPMRIYSIQCYIFDNYYHWHLSDYLLFLLFLLKFNYIIYDNRHSQKR